MAGSPDSPSLSAAYLAENNGQTLIAISGLFISLDTAFVALRFYARRLSKSPLGLDDIIMPFAWLSSVGLCILGITMVHDAGVGRHLAYIMQQEPTAFIAWAKSIYALEWMYLAACALPKISILLLYLRILPSGAARVTTKVLIYILLVNWAVLLIVSSLQCIPFEYQWDKKIKGGKCFNEQRYFELVSVPNIATDLVILVVPLRTILGLHISVPRKIGIFIVFLTGSMGIIASCARMAAFFATDAFVDNTYASVKLVGWSIIEPSMYLLAASAMNFRPIFSTFAQKMSLKEFFVTSARSSANAPEDGKTVALNIIDVPDSGFRRINSS